MSGLPPRVDWDGNKREASGAEVARAEGTAARIRREVAEIRAAVERLNGGSPFESSVAEFLSVQANLLERCGGTAQRADSLRLEGDTREVAGLFPTAARSALLIARAIPERQIKPQTRAASRKGVMASSNPVPSPEEHESSGVEESGCRAGQYVTVPDSYNGSALCGCIDCIEYVAERESEDEV